MATKKTPEGYLQGLNIMKTGIYFITTSFLASVLIFVPSIL